MFKSFQKGQQFKSFPNLNFQVNNEAYGFSGCTLWLDAAYGLNTQTNAASVSTWYDKIKGIPFVQNTAANQPILSSADVSFNNYPAIHFNTEVKFLKSLTDNDGGLISRQGTFVIVYQYLTSGVPVGSYQKNSIVHSSDFSNVRTSGNAFCWSVINVGTPTNRVGFYLGTNSSLYNTSDIYNTSTHIVVVSDLTFISDGVQSTMTGTTYNGFLFTNINGNGGDFTGVCKVAEILTYGTALNSQDCVTLCDRINTKYAIY